MTIERLQIVFGQVQGHGSLLLSSKMERPP